MDKRIYGIAGLFSTPDGIIHAVKTLSDSGYTKFDAHTPYPVHGMDKAMKLPPSKLGFITLGFGLAGTATALLLMYITMAVDYPMIIGGKPFFALPAFIPVTFELTVLFATLATVIGMLTFFFRFPDNAHPLHDTPYLKQVSKNKFGVCIESNDPLFNEEDATALLSKLGAAGIAPIYYIEKRWFDAFSKRFLLFLCVIALLVSGTTYFAVNKLTFMIPFSWMSYQARINAQSHSTYFADGFGMRVPVAGTVSRGHIPYIYKDSLAQPAAPLTNPLVPSTRILALGQKKFNTFCSPCHGYFGEGDGRLRGQFPKPPSLHTTKLRAWADGNIYHVVMNGQNVMSSYAAQLSGDEAWAIVNYVRVLQKAKNANAEEVNQFRKEVSADVTK